MNVICWRHCTDFYYELVYILCLLCLLIVTGEYFSCLKLRVASSSFSCVYRFQPNDIITLTFLTETKLIQSSISGILNYPIATVMPKAFYLFTSYKLLYIWDSI